MKIRALVPFSTGTITMEQYEIKEVSDEVGARLVAAGLVKEIGGNTNKFVVTLTPTAEDLSGTMDKTVAEINAAYEAGQEIWFKVITSEHGNVCVQLESVGFHESYVYPSFNLTGIMNGVLFYGFTGTTNDGTIQTYSAKVYALTPAT